MGGDTLRVKYVLIKQWTLFVFTARPSCLPTLTLTIDAEKLYVPQYASTFWVFFVSLF